MILAHTLSGHGPEPVLFLHDWLGDTVNYEPMLPYLDPRALTCARVDLPGYGGSRELPVRGVGADELDARVLAVADHLGWRRFHLVAHSMSTVIAQRLARAATARLASVVLTGPVPPGAALPDEAVTFLRRVGGDAGVRPAALAPQFGSRLSPAWAAFKLARWAASAEPATVAAYVDLFARPDLPTTPAPALPVLAIFGAEDVSFARAAVEPALRAVYPDLQAEVLAGVGHYPMQEMPPLYAAIVERFVRAHPA